MPAYLVARRTADGTTVTDVATDGTEGADSELANAEWPDYVRRTEPSRPRWAWNSTRSWYPRLLSDGIRVARCVDLALCGTILRGATATEHTPLHDAPPAWRAHSQLPTAATSDPKWSDPVGEGAKRPR